jgi:hypothetical protein
MFDELNGLRSRTANHEPDNHINFHRERHFHLSLFALVRLGPLKMIICPSIEKYQPKL